MAETLDLTDMRDDELKSALKSLKNKEAKLEADLAIKEHPELEGAITPIVLALNKFNAWNKELSDVSDPAWTKELKSTESQLAFYRKRVQTLEELRDKLLSDSEAPQIQSSRDEAERELRDIIIRHENSFSLVGISPEYLIPSLEDFI